MYAELKDVRPADSSRSTACSYATLFINRCVVMLKKSPGTQALPDIIGKREPQVPRTSMLKTET